MKINKIIYWIFILTPICGNLLGQAKLSEENYKTAVRIKLRLDDNPLLYMDEPKSAQLDSIHRACMDYIVLYEKRIFDPLQKRINDIDQGAKKYQQITYDQIMPKAQPSNIIINYFWTGSSGKD